MRLSRLCSVALLPLVAISISADSLPGSARAAEPAFSFEHRDGVLVVRLGDTDVASYVYRDAAVSRPYWAHVKTASGIQVTRQHPPRAGMDAVDHTGLHTGIWHSFGDLSGCDYWRLKARTEHVGFTEEPKGSAGQGAFVVRNRYRTPDGTGTVCEESCRYRLRTIPHGYLIDISTEFFPADADLVFGDQEEMGLGIRVATPIAVDRKQGGRMLDSAGRRNGSEIWGQTADWCDYSGAIDGKWVGLTAIAAPNNFRPCWLHARDYGFLAMNPFGRQAFTRQDPSRIVVKRGSTFRLHFAVAVHESKEESEFKPAEIFQDWLRRSARAAE